MNKAVIESLKVLANIADAYDDNALDDEARKYWGGEHGNDHENDTPPERLELYTGRGGRTLLTLADCFKAREALKSMDDSGTNRYILFCGNVYYASGGWNDFSKYFDNLKEATKKAEQKAEEAGVCFLWWHVMDSHTNQIVAQSENKPQT